MKNDVETARRPGWLVWAWRAGLVLVAVGLAVQGARFAWHRTRPQSWQVDPPLSQRTAMRLPKLENPLTVTELAALSQDLPDFITARTVDLWGLLNHSEARRHWSNLIDEQAREELQIVIDTFESDEFNKTYQRVRETIARGWYCNQLQFDGSVVKLNPNWINVILAHARYCWEIKNDSAAAQADYELLLQLQDLYFRGGTRSYAQLADQIRGDLARQIRRLATREKSLAGWKDFARQTLASNPIKSHNELLAGEIVAVETYFDTIFVPDEGWLDVTRAINPDFAGSFEGSRWWNVLSPVFADRAEAQRAFDRFLAQMNDPTVIRTLRSYRDLRLDSDTQWSAITMADWTNEWYMIFPYFNYLREATGFEATLTVLALGAFHHEHQTFPATLAELVPEYLPRVPTDYYDHQPLRYRRTDEAYVLYAVGRDGKDDGGVDCGLSSAFREHCDLIFGFNYRE